jgi:hypothetical protein
MQIEGDPRASGVVRGLPLVLLRSEGLALLALSALVYWRFGRSWLLFVLLLLAPDASMLGYLRGSRIGSSVYNLFHTYMPPAVLAVVGLLSGATLIFSLALIWFAHIGMDRVLGYGLKYPEGFRFTHLGRIGRTHR